MGRHTVVGHVQSCHYWTCSREETTLLHKYFLSAAYPGGGGGGVLWVLEHPLNDRIHSFVSATAQDCIYIREGRAPEDPREEAVRL